MRRREIITTIAALTGIAANMIILWNITTWDILEILFAGIICFILEVWIGILVKEFLRSYTDWQRAEQNRIKRAEEKKHRKEGSWDYDLRGTEEEMWYEVSLDRAI